MSSRGSKMTFFSNIVKLSLVSTFLIVTTANAGTTTWEWNWQLDGTNGSSSISSNGTNNLDSSTLHVDLEAWSDTGGSNDTTLQTGKFNYYSGGGWGLVNKDEGSGDYPGHAFDNEKFSSTSCPQGASSYYNKCYEYKNGSWRQVDKITTIDTDYDMALVSFDTSVELTEINFGWTYSDADFTVLAYTGVGVPPPLSNSDWDSIANNSDWMTVGNYQAATNLNNSNAYYSIEDDRHTSSQYWLIGAYNSIFGSTAYDDANLSESDTDAFKIKNIKGITSTTTHEEVPSPSAFGLLLIGALGIYARRNKRVA